MKQEDFDKLTPTQKMQYVTDESASFATRLLEAIRKWKGPETIKSLGLLQASVAIHKRRGFVSDEEYLNTVKLYLQHMKLTVEGEPEEKTNAAT